jgi:hypothetical protein
MSKWFETEKKYNNSFNQENSFCYLFSDASFLKRTEDFVPERQWDIACGILFKEDDLRRYFTSVKTKKDNFLNLIIPTNTFYDQFYIYDHNYIENEKVEIFWRDIFYSFSFNDIKDKNFEAGQNYMATRGIILKQTETHILLEVDKYLQFGNNHKDIQDDFKYLSIPKSYIRNFRKVGSEWKVAELKKVIPKLDNLILEGKISVDKIRNECDSFYLENKNKISFLSVPNKITKKIEYGIDFSYMCIGLDFKYIENINFNLFNRIKKKNFLKRIGDDKYIAVK